MHAPPSQDSEPSEPTRKPQTPPQTPLTLPSGGKTAPVTEVARLMLSQLPSFVLLPLLPYLQGFAADEDGAVEPMAVATACSGCDMLLQILGVLSQEMEAKWGFRPEFSHAFSVERDATKQAWLLNEFEHMQHLFKDVSELEGHTAYCLKECRDVLIPHAMLFAAGFSCTSRSRLNNSRSQNRGGIQNHGQDATATTWRGVAAYIKRCRPPMVVLENVQELDEVTEHAMTDAEYIIEFLEGSGYTCKFYKVHADKYGSPVPRVRLYFIGVHGGGDKSEILQLTHETLEATYVNILFPWDRFLLPAEEVCKVREARQADADDDAPEKRRKISHPPRYLDDHCDIFRTSLIEWPIDISKMSEEFQAAMVSLNDRQREIVVFCELKWPYAAALENIVAAEQGTEPKPEFLDVNMSLQYLLKGTSDRTAWRPTTGCLTGSGKYWMRRANPQKPSTMDYRLLHGVELMALAGWSRELFHKDVNLLCGKTHSLLSSFAGNAFSGFALLPVCFAVFTARAKISVSAGIEEGRAASPSLDSDELFDLLNSDSQ